MISISWVWRSLRTDSRSIARYRTPPCLRAPSAIASSTRYREDADRFVAALDEEYYLHYAGHKQTLDLEPIYERHSDLTTLEQAQSVGLSVEHGGTRVRELWRFSCEGYLGNLTREQAEKAAGSRQS